VGRADGAAPGGEDQSERESNDPAHGHPFKSGQRKMLAFQSRGRRSALSRLRGPTNGARIVPSHRQAWRVFDASPGARHGTAVRRSLTGVKAKAISLSLLAVVAGCAGVKNGAAGGAAGQPATGAAGLGGAGAPGPGQLAGLVALAVAPPTQTV